VTGPRSVTRSSRATAWSARISGQRKAVSWWPIQAAGEP
jgi:hypothetical protein